MSSSTNTTSTPPSGNGSSINTPAWSSGIINGPSVQSQFIVDDIVSSPRFVRVTLSEARAHQDVGKKVYNATTRQLVPKGALPPALTGTSGPSGQAFEDQNQVIADAENAVSTSGGDLALANNAPRAHHGDALAESDRGEGNSYDEGEGSSSPSSSSGEGSLD